jgi:hypothetical protein
VRSAREIPNQRVQQEVLKWMESGVRGMAQVRRVAAEIADTEFYGILDCLGVRRLDEIPNFGVLAKLVAQMNEAQSKVPAAQEFSCAATVPGLTPLAIMTELLCHCGRYLD